MCEYTVNIFRPCIVIFKKMDTAYLKQSVGDSLSRCLAEVSEKRPRDPIEYIAQWLYKHVENQNFIAQVNFLITVLFVLYA